MAKLAVVEAEGLPEHPLDAAAHFHAHVLPQVRAEQASHDVAVLFPPADHTHAAWRLAAIQELAREAVPHRVNAVAGVDPDAIAETLGFLEHAPGVTGQVLVVA